jgi:ribonuclease P protein subunit POP4
MKHAPPKKWRNILIGEEAEITQSGNKTLVGIKGKIINETKETLTIKTTEGTKKTIKNTITIRINGQEISGKTLIGRQEERIKS